MFSDSIFECTYWHCYIELPAKYFITFYNTYTKYFLHTRPAAHCMQHFCAEVNGTCKLFIFYFILQNNACSIVFFFQVAQCTLALCREWQLLDNNICSREFSSLCGLQASSLYSFEASLCSLEASLKLSTSQIRNAVLLVHYCSFYFLCCNSKFFHSTFLSITLLSRPVISNLTCSICNTQQY